MGDGRRLVISVCPRERGWVRLPLEAGGPRRRLDAAAVIRALQEIAEDRGLADHVAIREACAGGCASPGPNVSLTIHPLPRPGERADHVAMGWRTYVASLASLPCLAVVIEENLSVPRSAGTRPRRRAR